MPPKPTQPDTATDADPASTLLDHAWAEVTPPTARKLLIAAVHAFAERGYHGTTTRDIAIRAKMSPAAVYIHYPTKEDLLFQISKLGHRHALEVIRSAYARNSDPIVRLRGIISDFAEWHANYHTTARVVQYELSALEPAHYSEIIALRRQTEEAMQAAIDDGIAHGHFHVPDPAGTSLAALSLCIDIARWFHADNTQQPHELGNLYADLVLAMLSATHQ